MQVLLGPRRCEGVGLTDGEMMERLWSFMRRFSRMTKEVRPLHHTDVLCSALVYYDMQKKKKLVYVTCLKYIIMVCCCFSYSTNSTNGASSEDKSCFRRNIEGTNNSYWLLY